MCWWNSLSPCLLSLLKLSTLRQWPRVCAGFLNQVELLTCLWLWSQSSCKSSCLCFKLAVSSLSRESLRNLFLKKKKKKSETELTASVLKKRSKTLKRLKRTFFNWTKQDTTKSSLEKKERGLPWKFIYFVLFCPIKKLSLLVCFESIFQHSYQLHVGLNMKVFFYLFSYSQCCYLY